jgi:hypothetical protein
LQRLSALAVTMPHWGEMFLPVAAFVDPFLALVDPRWRPRGLTGKMMTLGHP